MERNQPYETKTLLVSVKTYPTPSAKYIETTCVSGITEDGHWIRLHPINFRSLTNFHAIAELVFGSINRHATQDRKVTISI